VVDAVAGFFERENARFALAGAFALDAYGMSRAASDVDFVTETEIRDYFVRAGLEDKYDEIIRTLQTS
jgi:hypothetical protein